MSFDGREVKTGRLWDLVEGKGNRGKVEKE
jgi:hypothetical protein